MDCCCYAGETKPVEFVRISGDAGAFCKHEIKTLMLPELAAIQVRCSGYGRAEIGWVPGRTLTRYATRKLSFIIHAAEWLHSMVFMGRSLLPLSKQLHRRFMDVAPVVKFLEDQVLPSTVPITPRH